MTSPLSNWLILDSAEREKIVYLWSALRFTQRPVTLSTTTQVRPHGIPAIRTSKFSLGFISTPLIWPVRKKQESLTTTTQMQEQPFARITKPPAPKTVSLLDTSLSSETSADFSKLKLTNSQMDLSLQQADVQNKTTDIESFQILSHNNRKNKPLGLPMVLSADRENRTLMEPLDYASGIEPFFSSDLGVNPFGLYDFDPMYSQVESMNSDQLDATTYNDVLMRSSPMTLPVNVDELFLGQHENSPNQDATITWGMTEAAVLQSPMWSRRSIPIQPIQTLVSRKTIVEMHEPSPHRQTVDSISSEIKLYNYNTDWHLISTPSWHAPLSSLAVLYQHPKIILAPTPVLTSLPTNHEPSQGNKTLQLLAFMSSTQSHTLLSMSKQPLPSLITTERKSQSLTHSAHEKRHLSPTKNTEPLEASLTHSVHLQHDLFTAEDIDPGQLYLGHLTAIATASTADFLETPGMFPSKNVSDSILPSLRSHFTPVPSEYLEVTQTEIPFGQLRSNWPMRTGLIMADSTWKSKTDVSLTTDLSQVHSFTETLIVGSTDHTYSSANNVTLMTDRLSFHMSINTALLSGRMTQNILPTVSFVPTPGLTQTYSGPELSFTSALTSMDNIPPKPFQLPHGRLELSYPIDTPIDLPIETLTDVDLSQLQISSSHLTEHRSVFSQDKWFEWGFSTLHLLVSTNPLSVLPASLNRSTKNTAYMDAAYSTTTQDSGLFNSQSSINSDVKHFSPTSREGDPSSRMMSTVLEHAESARPNSIRHTEITASQQSHSPLGDRLTLSWFPVGNGEAPSIAKNNTFLLSNTKPTMSTISGFTNDQSSGTLYREDGQKAPAGHILLTDDDPTPQRGHGNNSTTLLPLAGDSHSLVRVSTTPPSSSILTELTPCPCKVHSHIICLCGLAAGNSMLSVTFVLVVIGIALLF